MTGSTAAMRHPALQPLEPRLGQWLALEGECRIQAMNEAAQAQGLRNAFGGALRFVASGQAQAAIDYEEAIAGEGRAGQAGQIATRLSGADGLHDLFNALAWLRWPHTKAALNAFHMGEIHAARMQARAQGRADISTAPVPAAASALARIAAAPRSRARDRVTLFDENGALLLCQDPAVFEGLRRQDWQGLFVTGRGRLQQAELLVFGHGLMQKCLQPFKSMTGRILWLPLLPDTPPAQIDQAAAAALQAGWPDWPLPPLPVCGWPGWASQVQNEPFYADLAVFRPPRAPGAR